MEYAAAIAGILSLIMGGVQMAQDAKQKAQAKRERANEANAQGGGGSVPQATGDKFRVGDSTGPNSSPLPDLPGGRSLQDILPKEDHSPQVPQNEQGFSLGIKSFGGDAPKQQDEYRVNETLMQPTSSTKSTSTVNDINQYAGAAQTLLSMYQALKGPGAPQAQQRQINPQQIPTTANQFVLR